jgi:hypothetical protein
VSCVALILRKVLRSRCSAVTASPRGDAPVRLYSGTSVARVKVHGGPHDYDAVVAADAAALAQIGAEVSPAIEKEAARQPDRRV